MPYGEEGRLEKLTRKQLIELAKVYSRNWQSLDGLWFGNVESACGLETAVRIDLENWRKQAALEAARIKKLLGTGGGLSAILTVLSLMSWQLTSPLFEVEEETPSRIVFHYPRCAVQEGRSKRAKPVFGCKQMKLTLLSGLASVIEPAATVRCLAAPPDARHPDYWCRWELNLGKTV